VVQDDIDDLRSQVSNADRAAGTSAAGTSGAGTGTSGAGTDIPGVPDVPGTGENP
jgi:hypothetical protein